MKNLTGLKKKENKLIQTYPIKPVPHLHDLIDEGLLYHCLAGIKKHTPISSFDRSLKSFHEHKSIIIPNLISELNQGTYYPAGVKLEPTTINHKARTLAYFPVEDELMQRAVKLVLEPIYEQLFYPFSIGYRNGKTVNNAHYLLYQHITFGGYRYIIKADLKDYFDSVDHACLMEFLRLRIDDDIILHLMEEWLAEGVDSEHRKCGERDGRSERSECGECGERGGHGVEAAAGHRVATAADHQSPKERPQGLLTGSPLSPLLSNIYLHYVLDDWFTNQIQPLMHNTSFMVRYADDFIMGFNAERDARSVYHTLFKRLAKYNLSLNQNKSHMMWLNAIAGDHNEKQHTFEFLKHHYYLTKTKKGKEVLKFKTDAR
ncbi:hypothetical protein EYV94_20685 [Puteibacter caeruleilacunae]|nr:hypothetical protein EYV94_20685 [Puteibacter caeruleilacunae]